MLKAEKDKGREEINRDRLEMVSILQEKFTFQERKYGKVNANTGYQYSGGFGAQSKEGRYNIHKPHFTVCHTI